MQFSKEELMQIKSGRSRFLAMAVTYCLGVYNDNFYKQAASLIAVDTDEKRLQGLALILLSVPFVLFSAYAGWLADRFPKRNIVIFAKFFELAAMLIGAYGVFTVNWYCIMAMVFIMGLQSTIFSPALNGSIPELYPDKYVMQANSYMKLATTVSVLMGVALAGVLLDPGLYEVDIAAGKEYGRYLVGIVAVAVALTGVFASFGTAKIDSPKTKNRFPLEGPLNSILDIVYFKRDRVLFKSFLCSMFLYGVSSTVIITINDLGGALNLGQKNTSYLVTALMLGIPLGALIANKLSDRYNWQSYILKAAFVMGALLLVTGTVADNFVGGDSLLIVIVFLFFLTGVAGGVFLIPVTSFIQTQPAADEKGRALATQNFMDFIGIIIGGVFYYLVGANINAMIFLMIFGAIAMIFAVLINFRVYEFKGAGQ